MEGDKKFILGQWTTPELSYLKDNDWVWTEKIDGTNTRIMWDGKEVVFGGRSDDAQMPLHLVRVLDQLFKTFEPRQKFIDIFGTEEETSVTLYGEGCGRKIQKYGENYKKDDADFILFDVRVGRIWLERENVEDIANKFGIKVAPIIGHGTLDEAIELTRKGFKSKYGDFIAEGIVARPRFELLTRMGERIITKVKHKDFNE